MFEMNKKIIGSLCLGQKLLRRAKNGGKGVLFSREKVKMFRAGKKAYEKAFEKKLIKSAI